MKKTLLYLTILAILGAGVWFFFFREAGSDAPRTVDGVPEDAFQIRDTGNIGKIFLAAKGGETTTLRRTEKGDWWLDNRYPAAQYQVDQLLATLARQSAQVPVAENLRDAVVRQMAGSAIKVELYNKKGERIRVFYVGGEGPNYSGTYMLMAHGQRPYLVQVPHFTGYLTPRFAPGEQTWRDRRVLYTPASAISRVSVQYADSVQHSFAVATGADGEPVVESGIRGETMLSQNARYYLGSFEKLYVLAYVNGTPGTDTLLAQMPLHCTVTVSNKSGRSEEMRVYYYPLTRRSKNLDAPEILRGINNNFDADNFYAVLNGGKDTAVIQRQMFDKVLRHAADFYTYHDAAYKNIEAP